MKSGNQDSFLKRKVDTTIKTMQLKAVSKLPNEAIREPDSRLDQSLRLDNGRDLRTKRVKRSGHYELSTSPKQYGLVRPVGTASVHCDTFNVADIPHTFIRATSRS